MTEYQPEPAPPWWLRGACALAPMLVAIGLGLLVSDTGTVAFRRIQHSQDLTEFLESFFMAAAVALLLYHLLPRRQDEMLLVSSLVFLVLLYGLPLALEVAAATFLLDALVREPHAKRRRIAFILWVTICGLGLPSLLMPTVKPGDWSKLIRNVTTGYLFMTYLRRGFWLFYDSAVGRVQDFRRSDVLRYMLGIPNLIGLSATISFYDFLKCRTASLRETLASGLKTSAICMFYLVLWLTVDVSWVMRTLYHPGQSSWMLLWAALLVKHAVRYWRRLGHEQLSVGLWRMFGYNVPDAYRGALRATSPIDYWRRWNIPWRDYLIRVFFNPVAMSLGRRYGWQNPWVYAVAAVATFLGNTVFDVYPIVIGFKAADTAVLMAAYILIDNLLNGVAVGVGLAMEAGARRQSGIVPTAAGRHWPRRVAAVCATYPFMSLLGVTHKVWYFSSHQINDIFKRALEPW